MSELELEGNFREMLLTCLSNDFVVYDIEVL